LAYYYIIIIIIIVIIIIITAEHRRTDTEPDMAYSKHYPNLPAKITEINPENKSE